MSGHRLVWCVAAALAPLLAGCGLLSAERRREEAPPPAPIVQLVVDAPRPLKPLLESNLDLGRLPGLAGSETVSEAELARLVAAAPAQARQLLETEGYFRPVVQVQREPGEGLPRVRVQVLPGPRTVVNRLTFEVEGELERDATRGEPRAQAALQSLRDGWLLQPGMPFRNPVWSDAKSGTLAQLRAAGYASATWAGTGAQVDAEQDTARLFVVADSGPLFLAGPLDIEGLEHHDASTVRHLADFEPGTPLTDQLLLDFQERLQTSGLFGRATVTIDPDPALAASARVQVRLQELPLQQATVGVGYASKAGPRASVEHWHRRLFGQPLTSRNKIEWGRDRQAAEGDISTHTGAGLWRWFAGHAFERDRTSDDQVTSARVRLGRGRETPREQRSYFLETTHAERRTPVSAERSQALAANLHQGWRRLDSLVLPTDGWSVTLQTALGSARDHTGASGGFGRLYARAHAFQPLGGWYASARVELGQVLSANDVLVPDPLRFRAGGDDSVRGYGYRELAPRGPDGRLRGGNALFAGSVELARPISARLPSVWGAVFVDAGQAAERFSELKPVYGVGAGVRWRSPIGPLKLDLAYATQRQRTRLHLSLGIPF